MKQSTGPSTQVVQSTPPAILAPPSTQNKTLITGVAVGAAILLVCSVIILYFIVKRSRMNSHDRKRSKDKEKLDKVTQNLLEIYEARNKYAKTSHRKDNYGDGIDTGYIKLTTATVETKIYSEPVDSYLPERNPEDSRNSSNSNKLSSTTNSSPKVPTFLKRNVKQKPEIKPKPVYLKNSDPESTAPDKKAGCRPMLAPQPNHSRHTPESTFELPSSREADNLLYGYLDTAREAENVIYSLPEGIDGTLDEKGYKNCSKHVSCPEIGHTLDLQKAHLGTSARMLNQYNHADVPVVTEAEQRFALYVPVGRTEVIYKVPTGVERHEPPSVVPCNSDAPSECGVGLEENASVDFYLGMSDIRSNSLKSVPEYEDVSALLGTDYEIMNSGKTGDGKHQDFLADDEPYQYGNEVII